MTVPVVTPGSGAAAAQRLSRRTGVEIELLAPRGGDREQLALELARRHRGSVAPVWHTDSEPSLVPGMGRFLTLSRGFAVHDAVGAEVCRLVDDVTIRDGLGPGTADPRWYRVLSDDARLLRLVAARCAPGADLDGVLEPLAAVFDAPVARHGGVRAVHDAAGATVAMAAPVTGERERVCEVVTGVLDRDHLERLEQLLAPAREQGFTVPAEAAVHLHLDAGPFRDVRTFAAVVRLFALWRDELRAALGTNPRCTRLGALPGALLDLVDRAVAERRSWPDLAARARTVGLSKFMDANLTRVVDDTTDRHTLEVRGLPGALHGEEVVERARTLERLLDRCAQPEPLPGPQDPGAGAVRELLRH